MSRRPPSPRPFDGFWERKLKRILARIHPFHYPTRTLDEEAADRRRIRAWQHEMYVGPLSATYLDPADVLELVAETIDESRCAGHRIDRMYALIPIGVHRRWCTDLVAMPDPTGWPTLDGVSMRADDWAAPSPEWNVGVPAIEQAGDRVEVWARHRHSPVLERYYLGKNRDAVEPIYTRLRLDGWTIDDARVAATLLHQI